MLLRLTHIQEKYKLWGTKEIRNGRVCKTCKDDVIIFQKCTPESIEYIPLLYFFLSTTTHQTCFMAGILLKLFLLVAEYWQQAKLKLFASFCTRLPITRTIYILVENRSSIMCPANSIKTTQFLTINCNKVLMNKTYVKNSSKKFGK